MLELRVRRALEFRNDALSQYLAEFHTPLVERIDVPENALSEDGVLIKSDKFAERPGRELFSQDRVRRPVAFEHTVRHEPVRCALSLDLVGSLAEGERLSLSEDICQEHVVMAAERVEWFCECDEVTRDHPRALMDQLIERVLAVRPRFTPVDRAGLT